MLSHYSAWQDMLARCYDASHPLYSEFGGAGVRVSTRWHSIRHFLDDMGRQPRGTELRRIADKGNYAPGNCQWEKKSRTRKRR